jgi:hypothetical protein
MGFRLFFLGFFFLIGSMFSKVYGIDSGYYDPRSFIQMVEEENTEEIKRRILEVGLDSDILCHICQVVLQSEKLEKQDKVDLGKLCVEQGASFTGNKFFALESSFLKESDEDLCAILESIEGFNKAYQEMFTLLYCFKEFVSKHPQLEECDQFVNWIENCDAYSTFSEKRELPSFSEEVMAQFIKEMYIKDPLSLLPFHLVSDILVHLDKRTRIILFHDYFNSFFWSFLYERDKELCLSLISSYLKTFPYWIEPVDVLDVMCEVVVELKDQKEELRDFYHTAYFYLQAKPFKVFLENHKEDISSVHRNFLEEVEHIIEEDGFSDADKQYLEELGL